MLRWIIISLDNIQKNYCENTLSCFICCGTVNRCFLQGFVLDLNMYFYAGYESHEYVTQSKRVSWVSKTTHKILWSNRLCDFTEKMKVKHKCNLGQTLIENEIWNVKKLYNNVSWSSKHDDVA